MYEYAIYKGDDLIIIGTKQECADELDVKPDTINFYCTPTYHNRVKKRGSEATAVIGERIEIEDSMKL